MSLVKNSILYTIGNILPKLVNIIFVPIYSYYLSPSDYGITASMGVFSSILILIYTLGLDRSLNRLYYDYKTEEQRKSFLGTITIFIYATALIITFLVFIYHTLINTIFSSIQFYPFYRIAIFTALLNVLVVVPSMYLKITEKASSFVLLNLSRFIITSVLIVILVVYNKQGAIGKMNAGLYSIAIIFPVYFIINYKIINFRFDLSILKAALYFSLPMLPATLSAWIINLSDRIFIDKYFSQVDVGLYSMGYTLAGFVLIISSSFFLAYSPYFYKIVNTVDEDQAKAKLGKANMYFIVIVIITSFSIAFLSKELIILFLSKKYLNSYIFIPIISLAYFFGQTSGLINLFIYQKKKSSVVMWIVIITALINIGLNYLLIPRIGVIGAAWATLISFAFQFIVGYLVSRKYYFIPFNWYIIIPLLISGIVMYSIFEYVIILTPIVSLIVKVIILSFFILFGTYKYSDELKLIFVKNKK